MPSIFAYQSAEVDWCESNFQYSKLVAEFYNTVSNVFFLIFGFLTVFLMHPYAQKYSYHICYFGVLIMAIGLFSMYYHMTLSFLGQLLDEISILWMLGSSYGMWLPHCYFPTFIGKNRSQFIRLVFVITVVCTVLTLVKPTINAYILNCFGAYMIYIVILEYKKISNKEIRHLIKISVVLWALALTSWLCDRFLCSFWQRIHFYYLHSIWHVLISFTCPYSVTAILFVDATYEMPDQTLKIRYWPRDTWPMGLPYLEVQDEDKNC